MKADKKVFISYSWSNPKHVDWVIDLAERLLNHGVDVIYDRADLKEGHDIYKFMESMVTSSEINKVIIVSDKTYANKANKRTGGVGTETQIISPEIYKNVAQEKFIPIFVDKDENGNPYLPVYLEGRFGIDFSNESQYEESYEKLLRNICDKPNYVKPPVGDLPPFITDDFKPILKTTFNVRNIIRSVELSPQKVNYYLIEFFENFHNELKKFEIKKLDKDYTLKGREIVDNIDSMITLRDDFINLLIYLLKTNQNFNFEHFTRFFEQFPQYLNSSDQSGVWQDIFFDNYKLFFQELFIYCILVGLKYENYSFINEMFYSTYFFKRINQSKIEEKRFNVFYNQIESIDIYYKEKFSINYTNPMADILIKRIHNNFTLLEFIEADLICFYISELEGLDWFPITNIYGHITQLEIFARLKSNKHFEKIKSIFNVEKISELKEKINSYVDRFNKNQYKDTLLSDKKGIK